MSKNQKIFIVVLVVAIGLITAGIFAKKKYDSLLQATSQGLALGETYGKMISQSNCMLGLRVKYSTCETTECELSANGYIDGCMGSAKIDDFCDKVPNVDEVKETIVWVKNRCTENSSNSNRCSKYMHKFVKICTEQKEKREISKGELFKSGFDRAVIEKAR